MIHKTENVLSEEIILAKNWILNSGIQNTDGKNQGGFNSWFDVGSGGYPYVYSEITGYGITTLLYLKLFFDGQFLDRARYAADWLIKNAVSENGGVRTRDYQQDMYESEAYSFESGNIYTFDSGMVLYGMISLYRDCKDNKYLEISKKIASFLMNHMRKEDGFFYASYDPATKEKADSPWKWSTQSGSYHAKLALGFTDLYEVTGEEVYKDAALSLCGKAMDLQDPSGRFITSRADNSTHMHPHAYSAEGLLYTGIHFEEDDLIDSAERAVKWSLDSQNPDGGIPKKHNGQDFINLYRADILAQILRLGALLKSLGRLDETYSSKLEKLRNSLLSFQYKENDRQKGGFYYGFTLDGKKKEHINSWCSMFALQALIMYEESLG
ncbi:MAG: glycoside hydrolase family 88 protein, partial [Candidatus Omnitrophica bacterium]|nr:glycoside hydrolase family 88 protein [Candidatus Omnitrophota bacterium]